LTQRRVRGALAAAAAGALALAGCGLGGGGDSTSSPDASSEVTGEVTGEISFATLQLKPTFTEYIEGVIADFEEANPGTSVEWIDVPFEGAQEKIAADAAAGTLPDVVNLNPNFAQPLEEQGVFMALDDAGGDVRGNYVEGAWEAFTVPGEEAHYGYPWYLTSEITMYNADLFEQAGLDPEAPPTTLDQLHAQAEQLAAASGGAFYGMHPALENKFITDLAKLGVPLMSEDGSQWTFNTPEAVAHVERLAALYQGGALPPDSLTQGHDKEIEAYQAGQIALFPSGPNFLTLVEENAPAIAEATLVAPQITGEAGVSNMSVMGLLVPQSSDNKATATAFAEYMTNAENQLAFAKIVTILPSTVESLEDPYFTDTSEGTVQAQARAISAEQIAEAKNLTPVQWDDRVKAAVVGQVELALRGDITAQEALDRAVEEANSITGG